MARKKRHGKPPFWKKYAKMAVGLIGTGVGAAVALSPTYRGLGRMASGDFSGGAQAIAYDTTGLDPANPASAIDVGKVAGTAVTVAVGIGLMYLFRQVARRI